MQKCHEDLHKRYEYLVQQYTPLAHKCAHRLRRFPDDHDDLVQEAFLALFKAVRNYARQGKTIECEPTFVTAVFRRAMYHHVGYKLPELVELSPSLELIVGHESYFEQVFTEEYLDEVRRILGALAGEIVRELLFPGAAVTEEAMAEARRGEVGILDVSTGLSADDSAEEMALLDVSSGKQIHHVPNRYQKRSIRITSKHVRVALGLSAQAWTTEMSRIRSFTRRWLDLNSVLPSC